MCLEAFVVPSGSGGTGRHRDGAVRRLRFLRLTTAVLVSSRRTVARFDLSGRSPGAVGRQWVERVDGSRTALSSADHAEMAPGNEFMIETPGGSSGPGVALNVAVQIPARPPDEDALLA